MSLVQNILGEINEAALGFAHMAKFGNAGSRVYSEQETVFCMCVDLLPPLPSSGVTEAFHSNLTAVFTR